MLQDALQARLAEPANPAACWRSAYLSRIHYGLVNLAAKPGRGLGTRSYNASALPGANTNFFTSGNNGTVLLPIGSC